MILMNQSFLMNTVLLIKSESQINYFNEFLLNRKYSAKTVKVKF